HWKAALVEYRACLKTFEQHGDRQGMAKSRHQIGTVYQLQGDWEAALSEYRASLEIKEQIGDRQGMATTHSQLGLLYREKQEYSEALRHSLVALQVFSEIGDPRVKVILSHLVTYRQEWGAEVFDRAWREMTEQEVPEELRKDKG
ncbi:MAG: tetratricopeptide repeat protein, partial [bacterium]